MSDEIVDGASIVADVLKDFPLYEISDDLIIKWQGLAQNQKFSPELPRVAWDRLYRAIELLNDNTLTTVRVAVEAVTASHTGDSKKLYLSLQELTGTSLLVRNSLKQFQEMMMQAAVDDIERSKIDG